MKTFMWLKKKYACCHGIAKDYLVIYVVGRHTNLQQIMRYFSIMCYSILVIVLWAQPQPTDYLPYLTPLHPNPLLSWYKGLALPLQNTHSDPKRPALRQNNRCDMAPHLTECRKYVSPHPSTHGSPSGLLNRPRQEQLCSWPVLSACLRYDVTTTNLWCMIMNEFPVCVFACRAVDCVNLFVFKWIYV